MRGSDRRSLPQSLYRLIWRRTRRLQIVVIAIGLSLPALSVLPLDIQRRIVDDAIPSGDGGLLLILALAYGSASAASAGVKFAVYYLRGLIEARVTRFIRIVTLDAQRRRPAREAQVALGPVASILAQEAYPLGGFAAQAINTPLIEGASMIGVAGFMLLAEPWLALMGIGALALQATITPLVQHHINSMSRRRVNAVRRAAADMIAASAHRPNAHFRDALRETRLTYRLRLRMNVYKAALKAALKLSENLAVIAILGIGGLMTMRGETSIGVIVAFLSGLRRIGDPWDTLVAFYREFADAQIKYRLVLSALADAVIVEPDVDPRASHRDTLATRALLTRRAKRRN
jgi:ABC-type bacteriocin/lantibiotic exporter with double-glycine peptidase domain